MTGFVTIPPYLSKKKQAQTLRDCIVDVNNKYNKFTQNKIPRDQYLKELESLRSNFMNLVATRGISEDQYKMLDDMISSYANRAQ